MISLLKRGTIPVQPFRVQSAIVAGFRTGWINGEGDAGITFDLSCGAGCGSPYLTLSVKRNGTLIGEELIDIRTVVSAWITELIAAGPTPGEGFSA